MEVELIAYRVSSSGWLVPVYAHVQEPCVRTPCAATSETKKRRREEEPAADAVQPTAVQPNALRISTVCAQ